MAVTISHRGTDTEVDGGLPAVGQPAPAFTLTGSDLSDITLDQFSGSTLILNIFPCQKIYTAIAFFCGHFNTLDDFMKFSSTSNFTLRICMILVELRISGFEWY